MSDEPDEDGNVVTLRRDLPEKQLEPPLAVAQRDYNACEHHEVWLDMLDRIVTCKRCGMVVDPLLALYRIERGMMRTYWRSQSARNDVAKFEAEVVKLKRQKDQLGKAIARMRKQLSRVEKDGDPA